MKKALALLVLVAFLFISGCATTGSTRVKCPSCGYEFETVPTS